MTENEIAEIRKYAKAYHTKIRAALKIKYTQAPSQMIEQILERADHSLEFIDLYLKSGYPQDRLNKLIDMFLDVQFHMTLLLECHVGLYNLLIHLTQAENPSTADCPYLFLRKLSLDQGSINQSRALWEKLMNFVYFLENGTELEAPKKSKKTKFFVWVSKHPKWNFLNGYQSWIENLDNYRTPEIHTNSKLRAHFIEGTSPFPEDMLHTLNIVMNTFWLNLKNILQEILSPITYWSSSYPIPPLNGHLTLQFTLQKSRKN